MNATRTPAKTPAKTSRLIALHGYRGVGRSAIADHLVESKGYTKVSFSEKLYEDISGVFGTTPTTLRLTEASGEPQDWLSNFHAEDPVYRDYLAQRKEDLYSPRTVQYHVENYGIRYMDRTDPLRWVFMAVSRILALPGHNIVVPDLSARNGLREYHALQKVVTASNRELLILSVQMPGMPVPEGGPDSLLPPYAVDDCVDNVPGTFSTTLKLVDRAVESWFGD